MRRGLVILGMHRSGTSAVASLFVELGLSVPGPLVPPDGGNEAGYWEPAALVEINESLMSEAGAAWSSPCPLDFAGVPRSDVTAAVDALLASLPEGDEAFVIKDPRLCRTLEVVLPALDAAADLTFLHVTRAPGLVAASLRRRDRMSEAKSRLLWLRYTLESERTTRGRSRCWVRFEELVDEVAELPRGLIDCAAAFDFSEEDLQRAVAARIRKAPSPRTSGLPGHPWVEHVHDGIERLMGGHAASGTAALDAVAADIESADQLMFEALNDPASRIFDLTNRLTTTVDLQRREVAAQRQELAVLREMLESAGTIEDSGAAESEAMAGGAETDDRASLLAEGLDALSASMEVVRGGQQEITRALGTVDQELRERAIQTVSRLDELAELVSEWRVGMRAMELPAAELRSALIERDREVGQAITQLRDYADRKIAESLLAQERLHAAQRRESRRRIGDLQQELASARARLSDAGKDLTAIRDQRDEAGRLLASVRASLSWRTTAPLRRTMRLVRKLRRRSEGGAF